jgi:hypothetical protein
MRSFSFAEGERFAKANDLLFLEASAKTGDYVEETMVTAAINVLERINNGQFRMDDEVSTTCLLQPLHTKQRITSRCIPSPDARHPGGRQGPSKERIWMLLVAGLPVRLKTASTGRVGSGQRRKSAPTNADVFLRIALIARTRPGQ